MCDHVLNHASPSSAFVSLGVTSDSQFFRLFVKHYKTQSFLVICPTRLTFFRMLNEREILNFIDSRHLTLSFVRVASNAVFRIQLKIPGADKSLARPGRKQARKHVRDAHHFNNIETRAVIKFFFFCKARRRRKFTPF